MSLTVPVPALTQQGNPGPIFAAVMPVDVACGPVTFPDGSELTLVNAQTDGTGLRLFRQQSGGTIQVWDPNAKIWQPEGTETQFVTVFYLDNTWKSIIVDAEQSILGTDTSIHFPVYFVRCYFSGIDAQGVVHTGMSPASAAFEAIEPGGQDRGAIVVHPDLENATLVRLLLSDDAPALTERAVVSLEHSHAGTAPQIRFSVNDTAGTERGSILIRQQGSDFRIDLKANGSQITLRGNGNLTIAPAPGRRVEIQGDLNVTGSVSVHGVVVHP